MIYYSYVYIYQGKTNHGQKANCGSTISSCLINFFSNTMLWYVAKSIHAGSYIKQIDKITDSPTKPIKRSKPLAVAPWYYSESSTMPILPKLLSNQK